MLRSIKLLFVEVTNDFVTWLSCKLNISRSRRKMVARNISDLSLMDQVIYQARARSALAQRACALRALGLLLADGAPTVGRGKTF